jgi:hypothetical protein
MRHDEANLSGGESSVSGSNPTPPQLQTALMGGAITENGTTVEYAGILQLRADGKGWGEIAHSVGLKLGPIVSGMKAHNQGLAAVPSAATHRIHSAAAPRSSSRMAEQRATGNTEPRSRGIVTAEGTHPKAGAAHGHGKGHRGVATTDAGRAARGQGIVTAAGHGASPGANGAAAGKGPVATAAGGTGAGSARGAGNHKALGHGKK